MAQLKWWKLTLGQRYSESRAEVESAVARMQLPTELSKVYFLDFAVVPEVRLRAERVMETQSEVQKDEWVARALVDWRFD
ncbi:MAG TPA: hypothetical protein PKC28_00425 [Bdellovibrionales bacterium]|nr:hypothetical protein [Bdellovibrionales bacterium]